MQEGTGRSEETIGLGWDGVKGGWRWKRQLQARAGCSKRANFLNLFWLILLVGI